MRGVPDTTGEVHHPHLTSCFIDSWREWRPRQDSNLQPAPYEGTVHSAIPSLISVVWVFVQGRPVHGLYENGL